MATRPATAPEQMPRIEGLPLKIHSTNIQPSAAAGGGDLRHRHGHAGISARRERGAGVEAEPAHPQQRRADHCQDQIMRWHRFFGVAYALAEHERGDQAADAGVDN